MDPVDPRAAQYRVDRAGGAENQHRLPVAPGVEDRHRTVQQTDVAVQRHRHGLTRSLGVAVRDRHRVLLVQA